MFKILFFITLAVLIIVACVAIYMIREFGKFLGGVVNVFWDVSNRR